MANFILRGLINFKILAIFRESQNFIELLSYSETKGASAGFTFQGLSWGRSKTLVTRDLTLPGLTARYLNYMRTLQPYYNGKLIIAIDELHKIHDPEMVKALLVELKGALFEKGCYYLISISEDAARSFRSRLGSGRDIFESTFDDVVEVRQMTSGGAIPMVRKRLGSESLSDDDIIVLTLFGGGIPREIVRNLRTIAFYGIERAELTPKVIAQHLLQKETQEWNDNLGEVGLSGQDAILLREEVSSLIRNFENIEGMPDPKLGNLLWDRLTKCLGIIDQEELRLKVVDVEFNGEGKPPLEYLRYQHIVRDIQNCIRLLILTTVFDRICQDTDWWKRQEDKILACFRTLADKPALAESILLELRKA